MKCFLENKDEISVDIKTIEFKLKTEENSQFVLLKQPHEEAEDEGNG